MIEQLNAAIDAYNEAVSKKARIMAKRDEPMAQHTSFRIGGPVSLFAACPTAEALCTLIRFCREYAVPYIVLGNGTNVLFSDEGYEGVVIATGAMQSILRDGNTLLCDAGVSLTAASKAALGYALTGLEFAHGIPGTCGGAVVMNAGAYDGECAAILAESTYLDTENGEIHTIPNAAHAFGYRQSVYKTHPTWIVLSVKWSLREGDPTAIRAKIDDFMTRRTTKQPLMYPSAGSVFKRYPGYYTAKLIEEAGLKGFRIGDAQVSELHAGFIVNRGHATAAEVKALIDTITEKIYHDKGIRIEREVLYLP